MDVDGIFVQSGGTVSGANDFSDGTFQNGYATGTCLKLEQDYTVDEYINNVIFNSGHNTMSHALTVLICIFY